MKLVCDTYLPCRDVSPPVIIFPFSVFRGIPQFKLYRVNERRVITRQRDIWPDTGAKILAEDFSPRGSGKTRGGKKGGKREKKRERSSRDSRKRDTRRSGRSGFATRFGSFLFAFNICVTFFFLPSHVRRIPECRASTKREALLARTSYKIFARMVAFT